MQLPDLTRNQWIAVAVLAVIAVLFSLIFTRWWHGEAIEVSVENGGSGTVFAYIDNTGRHGSGTAVEKLQTTAGKQTPSGLVLRPMQTRSFGMAVGLGDSPTLHVMPVNADSRADATMTNDCVFDTVALKLEVPSRHARLKWTGKGCEVSR